MFKISNRSKSELNNKSLQKPMSALKHNKNSKHKKTKKNTEKGNTNFDFSVMFANLIFNKSKINKNKTAIAPT